MTDSEFRQRRQQLLDRFLSGEIDQPGYDRMLGQLEELESDSSSRTDMPDTDRGSEQDRTAHMSLGDHETITPAASALIPGTEVGGYRLTEQLGRGGMGEVWKARDNVGDRDVVVKVLPPELQNSQDEMDRVKDVFHRVHALQHQHVCPIYQLGQDSRIGYYLVMKFVDGATLSRYRRDYLRMHDAFPLAEVLRVLQPTATALDYAHSQKVVHRDVKPHNIMVGPRGDDPQLVDFGLAAEIRMSVTRISRVEMETSGTYPYMAPEQWKGELQDGRTDQYALAAVAYELLSGQTPFHAPDALVLRQCVLSEEVPEIQGQPSHVNAALRRAMAKSRGDRFESCLAFIESLRETVTPPSRPPRPTAIDPGQIKGDIALELKEATAALRQAGDLRSFLQRSAGSRMAHWRQAARQGIAGGQWLLGKCFEHGIGLDRSMPEAIDLYRQAARRGETVAQVTLGNCYLRGRGLPQNSAQAVVWFRKAARKGDAFAATALGRCYLHGEGIAVNVKEATRHLHLAAEQGHPPAQVELGVCYAEGKHVPRDEAQARSWLKLAADQGNQKAQQWITHLDSRQATDDPSPEPTRLLADEGTAGQPPTLSREDALTDVESEITRKEDISPTPIPIAAGMPAGGSAGVRAASASGPAWQSHSGEYTARSWLLPAAVAGAVATVLVLLAVGGVYLIVQSLSVEDPPPVVSSPEESPPEETPLEETPLEDPPLEEPPLEDPPLEDTPLVVPPVVPDVLAPARYTSLGYVLEDSQIVAGDDTGLSLWDAESGEKLRDVGEVPGGVADLAITPNTNWVTIAGVLDPEAPNRDGGRDIDVYALWIWGLEDEDQQFIYDGHEHRTLCARFSQGSLKMLSGDAAGGIIFWDTQEAREVKYVEAQGTQVLCLELAPRDFFAISGHDDSSVRVWDLFEAREIHTFQGHTGPVQEVALDISRKLVVSASDDGTLIVWDFSPSGSFWEGYRGEDIVHTLRGHTSAVTGVVVTPDYEYAISSSLDGTVRLWDLESGEDLHRFDAGSQLSDVAVDYEQKRVAAAGDTIYVWDLPEPYQRQEDD